MRYIKNEWIKLWSQKTAWMLTIFLCLLVVGVGAVTKYYEKPLTTPEDRRNANQAELDNYQSLVNDPAIPEEELSFYREEILKLEYRIANDLLPASEMGFDTFMDMGLQMSLALGAMFMIVIAASILSKEFSTGTIKMLLTRPVARWKILLSKLVTVFIFGGFVIFIGAVLTAILGFLFWGSDTVGSLTIVNGAVVQENMTDSYMNLILYSIPSIILNTLLSFMLGAIFGSSTLAVGIALLIAFLSNTILYFIAKYEFAKYLWFANDIRQFMPGSTPVIEDLTLGFSMIVCIVYAIVFVVVTFLHFQKRDVTA